MQGWWQSLTKRIALTKTRLKPGFCILPCTHAMSVLLSGLMQLHYFAKNKEAQKRTVQPIGSH